MITTRIDNVPSRMTPATASSAKKTPALTEQIPLDSFLTSESAGKKLELIGVGALASLAGAVVVGAPAAIGAAAGAVGIGAAVLGTAALGLMAGKDDSEYGSDTGTQVFHESVFAGCMAGIGAATGMTGAAVCAGIGALPGLLLVASLWSRT